MSVVGDLGAAVPVCWRCGRVGVADDVDGFRVNPHGPGLLCIECLAAIRARRWRRLAGWTVALMVAFTLDVLLVCLLLAL